jgi:hypothetical protein
MGFFDRLLKRPPSPDQFARMLIERLRASGETGPINYDSERFGLRKSNDWMFFLNNFYQQHQRLPKAEHENLIRSFLTTWHTSGLKAPQDFADATADLLPALRPRGYLEIDVHRATDNFRSNVNIPHQVIADHLVATLVYDLPQSMMLVNSELLDQWGVTFYEAMEIAKDNLHQNTRQFAKAGDMYAVVSGDGYDATRLLITDFIRRLEVASDIITMVPNRDTLYVCGSDDVAGLEMMVNLTKENFQHERNISGMGFQLVEDEWELWMPPEDHALYPKFRELYLQTLGQTYAEQKDLLDKRHEREGIDVFVATYSGMHDEKNGRSHSMCMWSEGVDTLLPETDQVYFFRPHAPQEQQLAAHGNWDMVRRVVGDLMEAQDMYPQRWRVKGFPNTVLLDEIKRHATGR